MPSGTPGQIRWIRTQQSSVEGRESFSTTSFSHSVFKIPDNSGSLLWLTFEGPAPHTGGSHGGRSGRFFWSCCMCGEVAEEEAGAPLTFPSLFTLGPCLGMVPPCQLGQKQPQTDLVMHFPEDYKSNLVDGKHEPWETERAQEPELARRYFLRVSTVCGSWC